MKKENVKDWAVIFDMDGVLLDSEPVQMQAFNAVMEPYGICFKEADFKKFIGIRTIDNFRQIVEEYGLEVGADVLTEVKGQRYRELIRRQAVPRSGIVELLEEIAERQILCAVASSSSRDDVDLCLGALGISSCFSIVTTGDEVSRGKPDPEIFEKTRLGLSGIVDAAIPPDRCVVIEDNAFGVQAACAAGMTCVAAPTSLTADQDFFRAVMQIRDIGELSVDLLSGLIA